MAKFPLQQARQELRAAPSTGVRTNVDTRTSTAQSGAAAGRGLVGVIGTFIEKSKKQKAIEEQIEIEGQKKLDIVAQTLGESVITNAETLHAAFKKDNADTTLWKPNLGTLRNVSQEALDAIDMSGDKRLLMNAKLAARFSMMETRTIADTLSRRIEDAKEAADKNYLIAVRSGDPVKIRDATMLWTQAYAGTVDPAEQRSLFTDLTKEGIKARIDDNINAVHAAIEAAPAKNEPKPFAEARKLATNPIIPETSQTTLRNAINAADTRMKQQRKDERQQLIDKTTSDTLDEYFRGEFDN